MNTDAELLNSLIHLREMVKRGLAPNVGICMFVCLHCYCAATGTVRLREIMELWPGGSGVESYPVPHPSMGPAEAYTTSTGGQRWNIDSNDDWAVYAANRRALLDWLIEHLRSLP